MLSHPIPAAERTDHRRHGMIRSMGPDDWDRRYAGAELLWTAEANRFLVAEAEELPPGRALDLACGEGRNAVWLAGRGWDVTGVDFSSVALQKAARLSEARGVTCTWVRDDLLAYRPRAGAFDLVIAFYMQITEPPRGDVLRRAASAVAPGGTLIVVAHDSANREHGYGGPKDASVLYSAADLAADLRGSGLTVERAEVVPRPVDTPDGERIALDVLLRACRG